MSDAKTILNMIEEVSPYELEKLDEIDIRVYCFVKNDQYKRHNIGLPGYFLVRFHNRPEVNIKQIKFTRSRDALKTIRPKDWNFNCSKNGQFFTFELNKPQEDGYYLFKHGDGKTEELAELYAIIQAIEYERAHVL